jgi:capsid protein
MSDQPIVDEAQFLRDLVKASRQRIHHIKWTDRDGTARLTTLTSAEASRLNGLAHQQKISAAEVLRQAAHVPNREAPKV